MPGVKSVRKNKPVKKVNSVKSVKPVKKVKGLKKVIRKVKRRGGALYTQNDINNTILINGVSHVRAKDDDIDNSNEYPNALTDPINLTPIPQNRAVLIGQKIYDIDGGLHAHVQKRKNTGKPITNPLTNENLTQNDIEAIEKKYNDVHLVASNKSNQSSLSNKSTVVNTSRLNEKYQLCLHKLTIEINNAVNGISKAFETMKVLHKNNNNFVFMKKYLKQNNLMPENYRKRYNIPRNYIINYIAYQKGQITLQGLLINIWKNEIQRVYVDIQRQKLILDGCIMKFVDFMGKIRTNQELLCNSMSGGGASANVYNTAIMYINNKHVNDDKFNIITDLDTIFEINLVIKNLVSEHVNVISKTNDLTIIVSELTDLNTIIRKYIYLINRFVVLIKREYNM